MKTELNKLDRLMIITAVSGLFLAAIAFLMPVKAEAGVVVTARLGNVGISVSPDSPRGEIVQTGPRTFRYASRLRHQRPFGGHYFWVPGHYERVLEVKNCRLIHNFRYGPTKRTKVDHSQRNRRGSRAKRHNHYREVWVPGHWERA